MATESTVPMRGKILVVDDNPIIQRAVYFALRDHGYKVLMTGEVFAAINIIREEQPDLILVDLSFPMDSINVGGPVQDGFFFIEWIRRTEEVETIPIVIISGTEPAQYQERANALGVKACLHKPLEKEELLKVVQRVLAEHAAASQPGHS